MNKVLKLKDLFKIDFSSKGGGKLADKIFNKYNITKEEREEVKNEIASGGGAETSKNIKYYKFIADLDKDIIVLLLAPITEIIYEYYHREEGRYINKCSSGRLVMDSYSSGSIISVFAFIDNIENFYFYGIEFKNYKEYVNMVKENFDVEVEFENMFEEIDKETYNKIFNDYISNITA